MEKHYIKNDNNRIENPCLTPSEGKKRLRRGEEEGKKRLRSGREEAWHAESWVKAGLKQGIRLRVLRVAAVLGVMIMLPFVGWGQNPPFEVTMDEETPALYWIQSCGENVTAQGFYVIPNPSSETDGTTQVSTTNTPNMTKMLWYFKEAGEYDSHTFYYIVNNENKKCLYHFDNSDKGIRLGTKTSAEVTELGDDEKHKYWFYIEEHNFTNPVCVGYYIRTYAKNSGSPYYVNKKGGNVGYPNGLKASTASDGNSGWDFIAKTSVHWPQPSLPFTVSTPADKHYYLIQNAHPSGTSFYMSTDNSGNNPYVTFSNSGEENKIWYFMEAATDPTVPDLKYYYIVNAVTSKYMKFTKTANGNSQSDAIQLYGYDNTDEDRFQFVVVNAIGNTYTAYSIMPKLCISYYNDKNNSLKPNIANNNGTPTDNLKLGIYKDRNDNSNYAHWLFESTVYPMSCAITGITYSSSTGKITITATPADAVIHYTTNGVTVPSSTVGTLYNEPFAVSSPMTIMAIATKAGYDDSQVETVSFDQVATPGFELTDDAKVRLTCATSGASIYYAMGTTQPTSVTIDPSNLYSGPIENAAGKYIAAVAVKDGLWINSTLLQTGQITFPCAMPVIRKTAANKFTIECSFPTSGVAIRYTVDGTEPTTTTGTVYDGEVTFNPADLPFTVKAIAYATGYDPAFASQLLTRDLNQDPNDDYYIIASDEDFGTFVTMVNGYNPGANYKITNNINASSAGEISVNPFSGILKSVAKADGTFPVVSRLSHAIFNTVNGGKVYNVILKDVIISGSGNIGAICNEATGTSRIYNCGILPTTTVRNAEGDITGFEGSSVGTSGGSCGSLVGLLDGTARVINCFSYANITSGGGTGYYVGGLVGNNSQSSNQNDLKTIVVNCMFYGDIDTDNCSNYAPVYGNNSINNDATTGINPYDYFREEASFDNHLPDMASYKRSWPAKEEYLTRFEYYRSILNSNRQLMAWWVSGNIDDTALIAKWVLDPGIAPYPVLKKWGKYPSIINPDSTKTWNPLANNGNGDWVQRNSAQPYQGKILSEMGYNGQPGKLKVTVNGGSNNSSASKTLYLPITDMDTLNHDYCYAKIQFPYYNEQFGDPTSDVHATRYGNNYTDKVVTGWKITSITGGVPGVTNNTGTDANGMAFDHTFTPNWETGYNFADRYCTNKDLYSVSKRVFAQGGFFYVPEGVTEITIEAYWGKAVYLQNYDNYLDRVNITNNTADGTLKLGDPFVPSGTLPDTYTFSSPSLPVYDSLPAAICALDQATNTGGVLNKTVYDQAIVLLSNIQWRNENNPVGTNINSNKWYPFTIMSIDRDLDNEPDYCFEFQFRQMWGRPGIQPIRFDFLPVPELGMAVRHNDKQNTIGIFVPQGHFEITETSFMHTTQFEYDASNVTKVESPVILNGGHFEQIVIRYGSSSQNTYVPANKTSYILMGGHFRMLRFTPGAHTNRKTGNALVRLCAVNAIGGEYPEFYLSGLYRPDINPSDHSSFVQGNPHCYTNGGKFGIVAGAGYDKILGSVTFKIDHSIIREFYGGGINGANPVGGSINVIIDHSIVQDKYCGGPKVGSMESGKTVITYATGTTFNRIYGGGNGGTSYYRDQGYDGNDHALPAADSTHWSGNSGIGTLAKFKEFNPLNTRTVGNTVPPAYYDSLGYHALFEFECFVSSNGLNENPTLRTYTHWAQFGKTSTGNITTFLDGCTVKKSFYGGGNLGNVAGTVTSTLKDCTIMENVFGGGFSSKIEPFRIHNKGTVVFPEYDKSGVMQHSTGEFTYIQDNGVDRYYTWSNASGHDPLVNPTFQGDDGKWYVYTTVSLVGLGEVSNNVELILKGNTTVGHTEGNNLIGGNVYGGGDMSAVNGNATVTIKGNAEVKGNVFGGGNAASVGVVTSGTPGNTTVKLQEGARVLGNVYGGGNEGAVGGDSKVEIKDEE